MADREISYKDLEAAYAAAVRGAEEPDVMWMNGEHLKFMAERYWNVPDATMLRDMDGNIIHDGLVYAVTREGIFPVNNDGQRVRVM